MKPRPEDSPLLFRFILLVSGVGALALAGYIGYTIYPRFDLPAASRAALLSLAAMAGVASFFSPCSFPLLLTLLARATPADHDEGRLLPALRFAAALSVGAALFLLPVGAALALGGGVIIREVTFTSLAGRLIRAGAGLGLILLGLIQTGMLPNIFDRTWRLAAPLLKIQARTRRSHPTLAFGLYGFSYVLAGFG